MSLFHRRNPPSGRPHRLGGPVPPPPDPTLTERRAADKAARAARQAEVDRERALKARLRLALEARRAEYRRRRGSPPEVAWNYIELIRRQGGWYGDDDPDWELPAWMQRGYDPMAHRDYWLSRLDGGPR